MKVLITGSTGMVGKSVLLECLEHEEISEITLINRSQIGFSHLKTREIIHSNFIDFNPIYDQLDNYDACFHCMGVSSLGMNEADYSKITFDITKSLADILYKKNPNMVFNYVSGTATDRSEQGTLMWARVKGKTENYIFNKGFKDAYAFRPGGILPEKGVKSKTGWVNFLYTVLKPFFSILDGIMVRSSDFGMAMINSILRPQELKILENKDITLLSKIS